MTDETRQSPTQTVSHDWLPVTADQPELNQMVVCTDGRRRWLDCRTDLQIGGGNVVKMHRLCFGEHTATHYYPIPCGMPEQLNKSSPQTIDDVPSCGQENDYRRAGQLNTSHRPEE